MITYRLADALPHELLEKEARRHADAPQSVQAVLDRGLGSCLLARPDVAAMVLENWRRRDGSEYRLYAWVVMPNHIHVVVEVLPGSSLTRIVQGWKSYSAHWISNRLGKAGRIWQPDYWDRYIRDDEHFVAAVEYVENNPVMAGLARRAEDWPYSSAGIRRAGGPPALPDATPSER